MNKKLLVMSVFCISFAQAQEDPQWNFETKVESAEMSAAKEIQKAFEGIATLRNRDKLLQLLSPQLTKEYEQHPNELVDFQKTLPTDTNPQRYSALSLDKYELHGLEVDDLSGPHLIMLITFRYYPPLAPGQSIGKPEDVMQFRFVCRAPVDVTTKVQFNEVDALDALKASDIKILQLRYVHKNEAPNEDEDNIGTDEPIILQST